MDSLLRQVKQYLRVTWSDDDEMLKGMILRGQSRLNAIAGRTLSYETEGLAKSLLFDYVRYANSHALEVFEQNFERELLALHMDNQESEETENEDTDP